MQAHTMPPHRSTDATHDLRPRNATNLPTDSDPAIQILCAWPVSGQYGLGSRLFFYILIAAYLVARNNERIKNASLVGLLLLPAVSALHAITLAALHNPGKLCQ